MKKLLLVALALIISASTAYAMCGHCEGETPEPAKSIAKGIEKTGEFVGKVVSVTVAEPAKGISEGTVKVADEMGNPVAYTVKSGATIVDASLNAITLGQLKAGEKVKVKATKTKDGKAQAESIAVQ